MQASPITLVLTTLPDQESARQLARLLVEERLAACVNVLAPCHSVYHWEGALQENGEVPVIIKTMQDRYAALEADAGLLEAARETAERLLKEHPEAADRHVERWLGGRKEWLKV